MENQEIKKTEISASANSADGRGLVATNKHPSTFLVAIDPGPVETAVVVLDGFGRVSCKFKIENRGVLAWLGERHACKAEGEYIIEYPAPRGQPMYSQLVDTIFWIGRFTEALARSAQESSIHFMDRKDVKMHLCNRSSANDAQIRAALISKYSGKVVGASVDPIGSKAKPGPLYGIKSDLWAALAVAVTFRERIKNQGLDFLD
jgi:hypothetical protein